MTPFFFGIAFGVAGVWIFQKADCPTWFAPIRTKVRTTLGMNGSV